MTHDLTRAMRHESVSGSGQKKASFMRFHGGRPKTHPAEQHQRYRYTARRLRRWTWDPAGDLAAALPVAPAGLNELASYQP